MNDQGMEAIEPIRVLLAEDYHVVRRALRTHLQRDPGIAVVGELAEGNGLVDKVIEHHPDVLLMDLEMPNHDPVAATEDLRERFPHLKIVVLSAHKVPGQVVGLFQAGIDAYVLKDDPDGSPAEAVRAAVDGRRWISPPAAHVLANHVRRDRPSIGNRLTEREVEVLSLAARGYRNERIAEELVLSENTVRNHMASIFKKLEVETRVEAVVLALSLHLFTLDEISEEFDDRLARP